MPRNGSGLYSLPEAAFVPGAVISSAAVNSDLSDIANALTTSVATDGQSSMTGQLKLATGLVSAPALTWASDTDTGWYLIAAGNPALTVNGAKVLDVSSGLGITGTLSASGAVSFTSTLAVTGASTFGGQTLGADGTVALPEYSWTNDPDSGWYRIGANHFGFACNAAKVLDVSTTGLTVTGAIAGTSISITAPTVQRFTSGSAQTYNTPANVRYLRVQMVGGGGGGGAVTVNVGTAGGDTIFDTWTAIKGNGGGIGSNPTGGNGGTSGVNGTGILVNRVDGAKGGGGATNGGAAVTVSGGGGGVSFFGGAGAGVQQAAGTAAATNSGSGGGGGSQSAGQAAGGGGAGEYVEFLITSPAASYTYTVGAKGTGGTAGTVAGGDGGAGIIIVTEYYA